MVLIIKFGPSNKCAGGQGECSIHKNWSCFDILCALVMLYNTCRVSLLLSALYIVSSLWRSLFCLIRAEQCYSVIHSWGVSLLVIPSGPPTCAVYNPLSTGSPCHQPKPPTAIVSLTDRSYSARQLWFVLSSLPLPLYHNVNRVNCSHCTWHYIWDEKLVDEVAKHHT